MRNLPELSSKMQTFKANCIEKGKKGTRVYTMCINFKWKQFSGTYLRKIERDFAASIRTPMRNANEQKIQHLVSQSLMMTIGTKCHTTKMNE